MNALDAANYLIYLMSDACEDLTNMKLNKLLYYAQGHYLKKYGIPMFEDEIEAWEHGPVIAVVYTKYKCNGNDPITIYAKEDIEKVQNENIEILFEVAREYGKYTASALRNMTHALKSPWDQTYEEGKNHKVIPKSLIHQYFVETVLDIEPVKSNYTEEEFIGYRDENGILVLPKE